MNQMNSSDLRRDIRRWNGSACRNTTTSCLLVQDSCPIRPNGSSMRDIWLPYQEAAGPKTAVRCDLRAVSLPGPRTLAAPPALVDVPIAGATVTVHVFLPQSADGLGVLGSRHCGVPLLAVEMLSLKPQRAHTARSETSCCRPAVLYK